MFQDMVRAPMFSEEANAWGIGSELQEEVPFILEDLPRSRLPCGKHCSS